MNIRNELENSIPKEIRLTEKEKSSIRQRLNQPASNKHEWRPALITVLGLMIVCILILPSMRELMIDEHTPSNQLIDTSGTNSVDDEYITNASENDISYDDGQIISVSDTLDDGLYHLIYKNGKVISVPEDNKDDSIKDKTIEVFYSNYSDAPDLYYYEEYRGEYLYKGNLDLVRVVKTSSGWNATFSGRISEWVE